MHCQLARYVKKKVNQERVGWFLWVSAETRPTVQPVFDIDTGRLLKPRLAIETPYFNPETGRRIVISMWTIELYPIPGEFAPRSLSWQEFIDRAGELPPQLQQEGR